MFTELRRPAAAGSFYPRDPSRLASFLARHLDPVPNDLPAPPVRALIVPHAGYQYSGATAARCFSRVQHGQFSRVIVMAPSHYVGFRQVAVGPYAGYDTPLGTCPVDIVTCAQMLEADDRFVPREDCHRQEHSLEVQLPFIRELFPECGLVPLVLGQLQLQDIRRAAAVLTPFWRPDTLVVVSSDFTHYGAQFGFEPFPRDQAPDRLRELDEGAIERICDKDMVGFWDYVGETGATICGRVPIAVLLGMIEEVDGGDITVELEHYTNVGELLGDYGHSVSYAGLVVLGGSSERPETEALNQAARRLLLETARSSIESCLRGNADLLPDDLPERVLMPGAAFVSLHLDGQLRGCIGTLKATEPLIESVRHHAISAAFHDSRFPPLTVTEWPDVDIEVSCLTPMRRVNRFEEFLPGRHGVVLEFGSHRAVFLPQVAVEQGWDRETTLANLCAKARLARDAWRDPEVRFLVFEAVVFGDTDSADGN